MFAELPETLPAKSKKRKRAVFLSAIVHVCLVSALILVQMLAPGKLAGVQLLSTLYMAPLPPPPAPPPPPPGAAREEHKAARAEETTPRETPKVVEQPRPEPVEKPVNQPVVIPSDVARLLEAAPPRSGGTGVVGGVPGGVAGGIPDGVLGGQLGGVLGGAVNAPPPPPPKAPVRVGGSIAEPKVTKLVQPVYPPNAVRAKIEGVVVLEATVTEKGTVEKVKLVSGPPELVDAAVQAVQQWRYEPTRLNGTPVPVLLTATVSFSLKNQPR